MRMIAVIITNYYKIKTIKFKYFHQNHNVTYLTNNIKNKNKIYFHLIYFILCNGLTYNFFLSYKSCKKKKIFFYDIIIN